jgi:hypothetical protein
MAKFSESLSSGEIAWDGTASTAVQVSGWLAAGFSFKTTAALAADVVFKLQVAPPSVADSCLPGTFVDVPFTAHCSGEVVSTMTEFKLPLGTPAGVKCSASVQCAGGSFWRIVPSATPGPVANVQVVLTLQNRK